MSDELAKLATASRAAASLVRRAYSLADAAARALPADAAGDDAADELTATAARQVRDAARTLADAADNRGADLLRCASLELARPMADYRDIVRIVRESL